MKKINALLPKFRLGLLSISAALTASLAGVTLFSSPSEARNRCRGLWEHLDPTMRCQVTEFTGRTPPPRTGGYYRRANRPEVYAVNFTTKSHCHVQNPSQMESFGGFSQVLITSSGSGDVLSNSRFVGECRWGNGLYRRRNKPEVYFLYDNDSPAACWVRTSEKVEQLGGWGSVKLVDDSSDLTAGRRYSERC